MSDHLLINQDSGNTEYYTPMFILDAARLVLGEIDLDPASCKKANEIVQAKQFYTKEQDGLVQVWSGRIWMNHPFGRQSNTLWINKLLNSPLVTDWLCITFACTSESWFQPLLHYPQCFLSPRTNYYDSNGKVKKGVTKGSVVTYSGRDISLFRAAFKELGVVK